MSKTPKQDTPEATVTVTLRNSVIYRERHYGPGVVEVPAQLAAALGLSDERVASAPGAPDDGTQAGAHETAPTPAHGEGSETVPRPSGAEAKDAAKAVKSPAPHGRK